MAMQNHGFQLPKYLARHQRGGFDVMSLFRTAPQAPQQQQNPNAITGVQQPGVGLPQTQQTQQTDANGLVPKTDEKPKAPLDDLKSLWETPKSAETPADATIFGGLDTKKVMDSAKQADFSKGVLTPELLALAAKGGEAGVQALVQAMNSMAQATYGQGAIATTQIVEAALAKQKESFLAALPGIVKQSTSRESLLKSNPLMGNPAVAPIAEALQTQFLRKNPNATSDEIGIMVSDVFAKLSEAFQKPAPAAKKPAGSETDWMALLSGSPSQ